jgi:hypothetical protein
MLKSKESKRLVGAQAIKEHKWFDGIDWEAVASKKLIVPYTPAVRKMGDSQYFPEQAIDVGELPEGQYVDDGLFYGF